MHLKTETFAKLFFLVSCTGLVMYALLAFYTFHTAYSSMSQLQSYEDNIPGYTIPEYKEKLDKYRKDLKYILLWKIEHETNILDEGQKPFIVQNCRHTNCYVTTNKYILDKNYTNFEAIVFDIDVVKLWKKNFFPKSRLNQQKYVFHSAQSSEDTPICNILADNFFNWTWTYKLDSDIFSPFIEVKDLKGNVVAPRAEVNWETNMTLLPEEEMLFLKQKKKAMAWISTKCGASNNRMIIAKTVQRLFKTNGLVFDIYGCGQLDCPKEGCYEAVKRDYYFYYAPEDSTAVDYVTKEVVVGYNNYAIPVVRGGANYRKFIPEGSYLNAGTMSLDKLVALVEYTIKNPRIYYSFHRWRKHYIISETEKFKGVCEICEYLNDENKFGSESVMKDFRKWWYSRPLFDRCFPKGAERFAEVLSYINESRLRSNW